MIPLILAAVGAYFVVDGATGESVPKFETGGIINHDGKEIYKVKVKLGGSSFSESIRDLFNENQGKLNKKIWDNTLVVLKGKPLYKSLPKEWKEFKEMMEIEVEGGDYVNPYYFEQGGSIEKKYKLGDKYSSDFDYDGMFDMGLKADVSWGVDKLKKLSSSFESVNYHEANKPLYKAFKNLEAGNKEEAEKDISEFHKLVKAEIEDANSFSEGGLIKWQDAQVGDSARVKSENKMGVILTAYGRKFHLKFVDGTEKTYDAKELEFMKDEFKKGGHVKFKDKASAIATKLEGTKVPAKYKKEYGEKYDKSEAEIAGKKIAGAMRKKYGE